MIGAPPDARVIFALVAEMMTCWQRSEIPHQESRGDDGVGGVKFILSYDVHPS